MNFTPFGTLWVPLRLDRIRRSPRLGFSKVAFRAHVPKCFRKLVEVSRKNRGLRLHTCGMRLAYSDFYESEQCVRMNFTPFAYLTIRSAARPNFSSPLRSPMKNFQRSQTRAHVPGLFRYFKKDCVAISVIATSVIRREAAARGGTPPGRPLPPASRRTGGRCPQGHPAARGGSPAAAGRSTPYGNKPGLFKSGLVVCCSE